MEVEANLVKMFELISNRQATYDAYTKELAMLVQPTVLDAIADVLEASENEIELINIDVYTDPTIVDHEQSTLMIACVIDYGTADRVPALMHELSPIDPEQDPSKRLIKVAIPLSFVFDTKEEIRNMLQHTLLSSLIGDDYHPDEYDNEDDIEDAAAVDADEPVVSNVVSLAEYKGTLH